MAERSKAPDSRFMMIFPVTQEHSGPRMWAWVRIPLPTSCFNIVLEMWNDIVSKLIVSTEPDLNQRPKDYSECLLQSSALPTELSVGVSVADES